MERFPYFPPFHRFFFLFSLALAFTVFAVKRRFSVATAILSIIVERAVSHWVSREIPRGLFSDSRSSFTENKLQFPQREQSGTGVFNYEVNNEIRRGRECAGTSALKGVELKYLWEEIKGRNSKFTSWIYFLFPLTFLFFFFSSEYIVPYFTFESDRLNGELRERERNP